ncbi:hypothetical protein AMA1_19 [Achromobacter phage AMA1]|nr:hypothetical protein AMA1_19 [Achromobacter phage AMA1]
MPYANHGIVSQDAIEDGIEITDEQYAEAVEAMVEGRIVVVDQDGGLVLKWPDPEPDPEPPSPDPPRLRVVSRFQGREAMWQTPHGETTLFEAAETVINDPETPPMYKRAWAELQEFRRDSEMLLAIAGILDLSSSDLDDLFILAESIKA